MWPLMTFWYPVAVFLTEWTPHEDWEAVEPTPQAIRKALDLMEMNIPKAHCEPAGRVAWLSLSVLQKQEVTICDQMQQMQ